ncbi:MAG: DUF1573 domain-containing protein [Bacteroidales bacterium]|nr:MAG: DUF1573 domain-containing protein [Bacteroidales bacterium]
MLSGCVMAQKSQAFSTESDGANITWDSTTTYDFGNVKKGTSVTATFEFTNNGNAPLVVSNVKGSCGCTSVEYPQQPVSPGAKGSVKAIFNASSIGAFNKAVTVTANISSKTVILNIKGQVVE